MEGLVAIAPNNEDLEAETKDLTDEDGSLSLGVSSTASSDTIAFGSYLNQVGQFTELYSMPASEKVYYQVGMPLPYKHVDDDIIVFKGSCGIRLEIGAIGTYVIGEELSSKVPMAGASENTILHPPTTLHDVLGALSLPNIVLSGHPVQKRGFETFIERIDKPGYRSDPMIKGKGIPIWAIAAYVLDLGLSSEEVVADWEGEISVEEVEAAMEYYQAHPEEIEQKRAWYPHK